jgi:glycosyltransferase involved in cell wall biosynthesis
VTQAQAPTPVQTPQPAVRSTGAGVAVFIPCLNEALTIGQVIDDFRRELPQAQLWVIDNNSTDTTAKVALEHGARVLTETRRGKGFAVRTAFRSIDADAYVMCDGDDTYPAEAVHALLEPINAGRADMTVGSRTMEGTNSQFHFLNRFGNRMYASLVRFLLRVRLTDILSGLRVMTRELVRTVPIAASGFEIEAELTVKTIERSMRIVELPIDLRERPKGSASKIKVFRDGLRIAWTIVLLFRDYKPLTFFGSLGLVTMVIGLIPGIGVVIEFAQTGLVPRLPSAVLAAVFEVVGILLILVGFVLSSISKRFQEIESKLDLIAMDLADGTRERRNGSDSKGQ